MAGIVTASGRDGGSGCDHLTLTIDLDGVSHVVRTGHNDPRWNDPLTADERDTMLRLLARWWKGKGQDLSSSVGRVMAGEEATNVKQYGILTRDITKVSIGSSYVNVAPGAHGERTLVEFTGCTKFRLIVHGLLNGVGSHQMRLVRDSDDAVLYESALIPANGSEREFDTGIVQLPAQASGLIYVRFQARSATVLDAPTFRRCVLMVR